MRIVHKGRVFSFEQCHLKVIRSRFVTDKLSDEKKEIRAQMKNETNEYRLYVHNL